VYRRCIADLVYIKHPLKMEWTKLDHAVVEADNLPVVYVVTQWVSRSAVGILNTVNIVSNDFLLSLATCVRICMPRFLVLGPFSRCRATI